MKKHFLSIIVAALLTSSVSYATSLKDAVEQTIDANPDILSEKFNKDAYRKYVDEEKADYYPTIDFTGYLEDSKTRYDRDDEPTDPTTVKKDGWYASFVLEQVLYDGGVTPSEVEEYKHIYWGNKYRSDERVEEILRGTIDSYMDLIMYQELINLSENNLKLHDDYLVIAKEKEAISGEILESYQVNSKKHYITDILLEEKDLQKQAEATYIRYAQRPTDGNICRPMIDESVIPDSLDKTLEVVKVRNYEILQQVEKIKEQRENLEQASANNLPTLTFQWLSSWDNDLAEPENGREDINRARLVLDWNLYEGGKTKHTTEQERLFLLEQQKVLDNVVSEVEENVKTHYNTYFATKERVKNLRKYVVDNRNIRDVYLKQLQDGTRTFIDILDAESELYRSEISALELEIDLYGKYYDLLQDMGMLGETVLRSKDQVCKPYVRRAYENPMKKEKLKENSDLNDPDLLDELGVNTKSDAKMDEEINQLISDKPQDRKSSNRNEITTLPKGVYTINVATIENDEFAFDKFKKEYNVMKNEPFYTYNMSLGTKVLYGNFDTLSEAREAMANLVKRGKNLKPFVDNLEKHRKLLEKYKNIN